MALLIRPRLRGVAAAALFSLLAHLPQPAKAGPVLSASLGVGGQVAPDVHYQATNLLLAAGYGFAGIVRPELGMVGTLEQVRGGNVLNVGWELRPMVVLSAPLVPLYARLVFAAVDPFSRANRAWAYGGSLGVGFSFLGLGFFAEGGVLPRSVNHQMAWVTEGRLGASIGL